MVHSTAPNSPSTEVKSLEAIKEEARKLAFPESQQLGNAAPTQNGHESPAATQANGNEGPRGLASLPAKPAAGFSQTGELIGNGPATVLPDPSNPSLPPREVSKSIPCRFYPNCKYGDHCVFGHFNGDSAELAKPAPLPASAGPVGGFYYPSSHPPPPFPFPPQDPHSNQGGMPVPLEYAHYMGMGMPYGANGAPYYSPASAAQYGAGGRGNPYAQQPFNPYGYMMPPPPQALDQSATTPPVNGTSPSVKAPQYSPSNGSPEQLYAATFPSTQGGASTAASPPLGPPPVDMYSSPVQNGIPSGYGGIPVFHPQQQYTSASAPQQQQQPYLPSSTSRQPRTDAVMAASGVQGPPIGTGPSHRKRNSLSLNTSTNRRSSTAPAAGSTYPTSPNTASYPRVGRPIDYDSKPKKKGQITCAYFVNNDCRNGDACEFAHTLQDGSDAKSLKQNIIGLNGATGDPRVLEDFRQHKEVKDREWRAKNGRFRDSTYPGYETRGRDRFVAPANGDLPAPEFRQNGKYRQHSQSQQRVPNGADFPALPATPRSESAVRQASASPEPPSDVDEKMATSIASLASVDSPKPIGSFASAAARAAHVPQPIASSRKLAAVTAKTNNDSSPQSPMTTAQNLSPDTQDSPILAASPVAA